MSPVTSSGVATSPAPGGAALSRMVRSQAGLEWRLLMRNGEQVLLTLVIPLVILIGLSTTTIVSLGGTDRVGVAVPGVLALAVLSTAFTAQAVATGFERRYGALRLLGTTPLPRWGLLAGKTIAILLVEVVQAVLLVGTGLLLGWRPSGSIAAAGALLLLGTATFSALGLALAGTLRAEATLAVANGVFLALLLAGGIVIPLDALPGGVAAAARWLPSAALGDGLRAILAGGGAPPVADVALLVGWGLVGTGVTARWFRWT